MTREHDEIETRFNLVHEELAPAGIGCIENQLRRLVGASLMLLNSTEAACDA